jgi:DNA-binding GntR family transcriptional regulator
MDDAGPLVEVELPLPQIRQAALPTIADQVFDALQQRILTLELPPRTRISEADVAKRMGVSRQPVREAFKRLAKLGFLQIRPQSATTVSLISEEAVLRARFIRTALEVQTCRRACEKLTPSGLAALASLIESQKAAIAAQDRDRFHALDDQFHCEICVQSGVGYVWELIHDNKAHMDRIRMLSLNATSQRQALEEHIDIFTAISARDPDRAAEAIIKHLSRILLLIEEVKTLDHTWFTDVAK